MAEKIEFETYTHFDEWRLNTLKNDNPFVINDTVAVKRYRVTIEEVEEPDDVIEERIKTMLKDTKNMHTKQRLRDYAKLNNLNIQS